MITTIAIIIITTIITHCFRSQKKKSEETNVNVLLAADELIRKTGAEIKEIDENGKYTILYQGGRFEIETINKTYIDIYFNHFADFEEHEAMKALYSINLINLKYLVWNCSLSIYDDKDVNAGKYHASLSGRMELTGRLEKKIKQLKDMLTCAFQITRDLEEEFDNENKTKENIDNHFLEMSFHNKMERHMKISEIIHSSKIKLDLSNHKMTLRAILDKLEIPNNDKQVKVKIILDDNIIIPDFPNKFMDYDIYDYIRNISNNAKNQEPTFIIELHERKIMICFKLRDVTYNRSYYTLNILGYSDNNNPDHNFSIQTFLELNLSDGKDDYWEVKYMIDDALDKQNKGNYKELTDEQRLLLKHAIPGLNADLYWGKKYHNKQCYFQALTHYHRAFKYIQTEWLSMNDTAKDTYVKIALYIGVIYMELGQIEKAHYYLDIAANYKTSIGGIVEFTNCLCNMGDPQAIEYINNTIKRVSEVINSSEDSNEPLEELLDFLYRRLAYSLINHKDYNTAEKILKDMIKDERNIDFANNELEYIQRIKEQNSSSSK